MSEAILVVDDQDLLRSTLQRLLLSAGYQVDTAATGQEAFSRIASREYSVALLDLKLPDLDGIDIASYLTAERPDCPVIILTGQASIESAMEAVRLGCYDYITKGHAPEHILHTVRRAIENRNLKKQVAATTDRYRRLAEATWEGIAFCSATQLLEVNHQFCEIFRVEESQALQLSLGDYIPGLILAPAGDLDDHHASPQSLKVEAIRANGDLFPAEVRLRLSRDNGMAIWIVAIRDLSQQREEQRIRLQLEERLSHAMRMESIGLMAGSVAHDLNNILSGLVTLPQLLLLDMEENHGYRRDLQKIREAGEKAAEVTADLLTIAGGSTCPKKALNLNEVIKTYEKSKELVALCRDRAIVAVEVLPAPHLPEIRGSATHLGKALANLVRNAGEALDQGGTLRIFSTDRILSDTLQGYEAIPPGHYAILGVADTGKGIAEEHRPHIFQPFYSRKQMGHTGTGLGLTVVLHTMRDHCGYIDLRSTAAGTVIELYFPVCVDSRRAGEAVINLDSLLGRGERVMVIDDEENQRRLAATILKRLGYTPCLAENGEEAIASLRKEPVDLLLIDLLLAPGLNGYETFKEIRAFNPGQRALAISGYHNHPDRERIRALGVTRYLPKPLSLIHLAIAIQQEMRPTRMA